MFCKSAGGVLALVLGVSCAHNVPQDQATGEDGRFKGAKEITLENNEGHANDIVTYPGGDRVDWKFVTLPDKKIGQLDIKLTWQPPRPGLQLAFDVFDEWFYPVGETKKGKKRGKSRTRSASIDNAKGKYYIRVYALDRGDAGKYKLNVEFKEVAGPSSIPWQQVEVPDPPKLAAIPDAEKTCDEFHFDMNNPACQGVCAPQAPPNWPGCAGKCVTPDVNNQACWPTMKCPNPPDRHVRDCQGKFPKCPDPLNPDPNNPNCDHATVPPQYGTVIKSDMQGSEAVITISVGEDKGVTASWTGVVLRGESGDNTLDGGDVHIVHVGKRQTVGKVHLTPDQITANPRVKLLPPPK